MSGMAFSGHSTFFQDGRAF